jgi:hypothetical protein
MDGMDRKIKLLFAFKFTVKYDVTKMPFFDTYQRFRRICCLCLQRDHCKKEKRIFTLAVRKIFGSNQREEHRERLMFF